MRLCVLLLAIVSVLADDLDYEELEILCLQENEFKLKQDNTSSILDDIIWTNRSCIIHREELSCFWITHSLPENVTFSGSYNICHEEKHFLNCVSDKMKQKVECSGFYPKIPDAMIIVELNISTPDYWNTHIKSYQQEDYEKLDPPQINASINSTTLKIQWTLPESRGTVNVHCFTYHLKINKESVYLNAVLEYNKIIDRTKTYHIKIQTHISEICGSSPYWSDWSELVVEPPENLYRVYVSVIASIAFVLPMILLAFLLACKFLRVSEKLFPSIPGPSKQNIKILLEKEVPNQVLPSKHTIYTNYDEDAAEILQVIS